MNTLHYVEDRHMNATYRVILEPEPDASAYNVIIPAFPRAHTFGTTIEEALANAREVIELELEDRAANGEPIPPGDVESALIEAVTVNIPAA